MVRKVQNISLVVAVVSLLAILVWVTYVAVTKDKIPMAITTEGTNNVVDSMEITDGKPYLSFDSITVDGDWVDTVMVNAVQYKSDTIAELLNIYEMKVVDSVATVVDSEGKRFGRIDVDKFDVNVKVDTPMVNSYESAIGVGSTYAECLNILGQPTLDSYNKEKKIYYSSQGRTLILTFGRADESYNVVSIDISTNA